MTADSSQLDPLPWILMFPVLWLGISALLSFIGGWFQLSRDYRAPREFHGRRWWFLSASFRHGVSYRSCINMGANADGLRFSVLFPFRFAHPPLFFPWSALRIERGRFLFLPFVRIKPKGHASVNITIAEWRFSRVEQEFPDAVRSRTSA